MNRSERQLDRTGLVAAAGAPRCAVCHLPLHYGTDRQGRTTEFCDCGYSGYLKTRGAAPFPEEPHL